MFIPCAACFLRFLFTLQTFLFFSFIILLLPLSASANLLLLLILTGCLVVFGKYSLDQFLALCWGVFVPFSPLCTCVVFELLWRVLFLALAQITFSTLVSLPKLVKLYSTTSQFPPKPWKPSVSDFVHSTMLIPQSFFSLWVSSMPSSLAAPSPSPFLSALILSSSTNLEELKLKFFNFKGTKNMFYPFDLYINANVDVTFFIITWNSCAWYLEQPVKVMLLLFSHLLNTWLMVHMIFNQLKNVYIYRGELFVNCYLWVVKTFK